MNENDERYADSGLPIEAPMTRRAALKLGAIGVLGAAAAAYLPGRARAGGIRPAPCRPGQGFTCGHTFNACGGPGSGCGCAFQYTGSKLANTQSYCVDFNVCCDSLETCPGGQYECPPNTICSNKTCCPEPVCMPACGANVPPASNGCLTPKGGGCACGAPGVCGTYQFGCSGNGDCLCYETTEGGGACGPSIECSGGCSTSADCPSGYFCATNSCCGFNLCIPCCGNNKASVPRRPGVRMSAG